MIRLVLTITWLQRQERYVKDAKKTIPLLCHKVKKRYNLCATVAGSIALNPSEVTANVNVQVKELRWVPYVEQHIIVPEIKKKKKGQEIKIGAKGVIFESNSQMGH